LATHLKVHEQTIMAGQVGDEDLLEIYKHATLFLYPSRYEGFGLPVLEAMACGVPVIASKASSLPEVVGEAGYLVDPGRVEEWCEVILKLLGDTGLQELLRERGRRRAKQFTWERTATRTIECYQKTLEPPK